MQLTFLGTSAGIPTPERGLSALALRLDDGAIWLVDCGEGTQQRLLASDLRLSRIERILLTHLHGDHCFGLPGLLATMGLLGRRDPVEVIGPAGLREWLETTLRTSATHLPYPLELREVALRCDLGTRGDIAIEACPLLHRVPSFAYVLREAPRRGHVDPDRARSLGVPEGPELGRLAAGETIVLADGRRIEPGQVLGAERPGRVLALCGDSRDSRVLEESARRCDVLVHECTYEAAKGEAAHRYGHSTSEDVAALAGAIRPALLVLTHFSSRYTVRDAAVSVDALRREVEERCPGQRVVMAADGLVLDVPPRRSAEFTRATWDERYAARDCVWGSGPNRFVAEALGGSVAGGRALDLACGEGRNAIWLAEQGWKVTGVDFSRVAVERARALARERGVTLELREEDATQWHPEAGAYDLVLIAYLQLPPEQRRLAFARAAEALAPGGQLFAIAHARRNLEAGAGGPRDPAVLWDAEEVARELADVGLEVVEAEEVLRPVEGAERDAIDLRVRAGRARENRHKSA